MRFCLLGTVLDSVANSRSSSPGCGDLSRAMLLVAARVAGSDVRGTILSNDEIGGIMALWRKNPMSYCDERKVCDGMHAVIAEECLPIVSTFRNVHKAITKELHQDIVCTQKNL